jgi:hypothetical protein
MTAVNVNETLLFLLVAFALFKGAGAAEQVVGYRSI